MANRRKAHLYFGSHKDCFVHGIVREWTSWLKTSQDKLNIITLTLSDGFKVFATFSIRPVLPSSRTTKAKNLQPSEYLEIDPDYAKCLGIKEGDQAIVECVPDVTVCVSMAVESYDQNDHEVLEENKERIVFQMLDQVRIISCKRPFAVWINQQPIFLKLVKSEPPATWVLIGNKTYVDIRTPADSVNSMLSPSFPTSPLPGRTDSQDSDESGQTGSTTNSYFSTLSHQTKNTRVHTSEPSRGTPGGRDLYSYPSKRFSQSDAGSIQDALCFPKDNEFPNSSGSSVNTDDGGMVTSVLNFLNRNLFHGNSPSEEQNLLTSNPHLKQQQAKIPFLTPREEFKSPMKKKASMSKSFTYGTKGKHSKTPSWHGRTEYELEKEQYYIKSISTPFMLNPIHVRVQELNLDQVKAVWDIHDYNEVFVHPSTLPDLFQASGGGRESYLVSLSFITSKSGVAATALSNKDPKGGGSGSTGHSNTPTPLQPKQSSHLPEKPKKDDLGLVHMITQLTNYEAITPSITLTPPTNQPVTLTRPQSLLTNTVVCHLRFATTVRFNNKRRKSASQTLEEVSISREGSTSPTTSGHPSPARQPRVLGCVTVLPHHIVMSGLIRQQLGVKAGSVVRLSSCHDSWKVNCRQNRVSLYLHPIAQKFNEASSNVGGMNDGRKKSDIIRAFKNWVSKFEESPYGCVFANNMVIPLNTNLHRSGSSLVSCTSEEVLLCKVTCKVERPSSTLMLVDAPHKIFAINVHDFKKDTKEVMNGIEIIPVIEKQDEQGINAKQGSNDFPSLNELTPYKFEESIEHFGGMEELFSTSYQSLINLLEHTPGGVMLICGIGRGGGVGGCGKTSLSRLLCKQLMESHHKAHMIAVSCTLWRGKRYESIQKRFNEILNEVIPCQPAVILLDDLDHCAQNITDVQREATGEGIMHLRTAQVFLDFVNILRQTTIKAVVIVTATNKDLLHPSLLHSKGKHIFSETIEIPPPTLAMRQNILQAILHNAKVTSVLSEYDLRLICLKTEGYQAIDLKVLVDRAISNAEQKFLLHQIEKQRTEFQRSGGSGMGIGVSPVMSSLSVGLNDFLSALDSYVPASLSGLSLHKNGNISFSNVGGLVEAKTTLQETLLWPSKYPRLFKSCPIKQHAGVLLYGAPGTGKTLLAGAVANEFGLNFVSIKGPELLNKFIGASEQSVRDLFTRAQSARPCILFFDEFDSLAPRRGHDRTGVTDRVVNQILTQLDGVEALEGVYVLAASSRPDLIDPALLRPGRIDKILLCNMPTEIEREQILKALSKGLPLSLDVDFKQIASMTPDYTGADLKALLYNAQLLQVRRTLETDTTNPATSPLTAASQDSGTNNSTIANDKTKPSAAHNQSDLTRNTSNHSTGNVWQFNYNKQTAEIETRMVKQLSDYEKPGNLNPHKKGQVKCLVTQDDLLASLASTKPSLTNTEKKKYETIYEKFLGKSKTKITDLDPRATLA